MPRMAVDELKLIQFQHIDYPLDLVVAELFHATEGAYAQAAALLRDCIVQLPHRQTVNAFVSNQHLVTEFFLWLGLGFNKRALEVSSHKQITLPWEQAQIATFYEASSRTVLAQLPPILGDGLPIGRMHVLFKHLGKEWPIQEISILLETERWIKRMVKFMSITGFAPALQYARVPLSSDDKPLLGHMSLRSSVGLNGVQISNQTVFIADVVNAGGFSDILVPA